MEWSSEKDMCNGICSKNGKNMNFAKNGVCYQAKFSMSFDKHWKTVGHQGICCHWWYVALYQVIWTSLFSKIFLFFEF